MKAALAVAVALMATLANAGDITFGNRAGRNLRSDEISVVGPDWLVKVYRDARAEKFEPEDPAEVKRLSGQVAFLMPWSMFGGVGVRREAPQRLIFTAPGSRDPIMSFEVTSKEIPLQNGFGAKEIGYNAEVYISVEQFYQFDRELEVHLLYPSWTFSDKWKKDYFSKVMKAKAAKAK